MYNIEEYDNLDLSTNEVENNEDPSLCAKCDGKCCKTYAGAYHPLDLTEGGYTITEEFLESIFNPVLSNVPLLSIDWWENFREPGRRGYFLRPRHVGGDIVDPSYGERCYHLTDNGCDLPFEKRPWACKSLKPNPNGVCGKENNKYLYALAWEPYHDILDKLCKKYDKGTHTGEMCQHMTICMQLLNGLLEGGLLE